jgi:predicted TIM-barrel fold metal-dependent hydrolase
MFIVDAQVHMWPRHSPQHPWPDPSFRAHKGRLEYTKEELLREMDAAGVSRVVLVPPSWQGDSNEVVLEAVRQHPDRFTAMGRLDIHAPGAREKIAAWREEPGMLGIRFTFRIRGDDSDDWVWAALEAANVPIMIVAAKQLPLVERAARLHPGLKIVIDHLAIPKKTKDAEAFADFDRLLQLAQCPNVAVKSSGLPFYTNDVYPYRKVHDYIRRAYDAFGPKRVFWGTDMTKLPCTYRQSVTMFTEELPWLSDEDKAWIMGRGLCEWIGWPLPQQ